MAEHLWEVDCRARLRVDWTPVTTDWGSDAYHGHLPLPTYPKCGEVSAATTCLALVIANQDAISRGSGICHGVRREGPCWMCNPVRLAVGKPIAAQFGQPRGLWAVAVAAEADHIATRR